MNVFRNDQLQLNGSVVTIGAFDGIHRGHQALISKAMERSRYHRVPCVVYTFDPPPRAFFQNHMVLTPWPEKARFLDELGVDYAIVAGFDEYYASRSTDAFIHELKELQPLEIWVGPDFQFGRAKSGSTADLSRHFATFEEPFLRCEEGEIISSSRIRRLLHLQQTEEAYSLLGRKL